jgi:hypothetical protein
VQAPVFNSKDPVATAVVPLVWGGSVVAVLQLTLPGLDPLGVYYDGGSAGSSSNSGSGLHSDSNHSSRREDKFGYQEYQSQRQREEEEIAAGMQSLELKNKAIKQMAVTLRDFIDFGDVNADEDFAVGVRSPSMPAAPAPAPASAASAESAMYRGSGAHSPGALSAPSPAGSGPLSLYMSMPSLPGGLDYSQHLHQHQHQQYTGVHLHLQQQSLHGRARTLRAQMMYQLLQLCIELKLGEEESVALLSLASCIAETFGRHFPPTTLAQEEEMTATLGGTNSSILSLMRSPKKEDFTLPHAMTGGSLVGVANYLSRSTSELQQLDAIQQAMQEETVNLNKIIDKLQKSRSKYMQKSGVLQHELDTSLASLEEERSENRRLHHAMRHAEARLK